MQFHLMQHDVSMNDELFRLRKFSFVSMSFRYFVGEIFRLMQNKLTLILILIKFVEVHTKAKRRKLLMDGCIGVSECFRCCKF